MGGRVSIVMSVQRKALVCHVCHTSFFAQTGACPSKGWGSAAAFKSICCPFPLLKSCDHARFSPGQQVHDLADV